MAQAWRGTSGAETRDRKAFPGGCHVLGRQQEGGFRRRLQGGCSPVCLLLAPREISAPHPGSLLFTPGLPAQRPLPRSPLPSRRQRTAPRFATCWAPGLELWGQTDTLEASSHPDQGARPQAFFGTSTPTQGRAHTSVAGVTTPGHGAAAWLGKGSWGRGCEAQARDLASRDRAPVGLGAGG